MVSAIYAMLLHGPNEVPRRLSSKGTRQHDPTAVSFPLSDAENAATQSPEE
jgi:hypothetical protein